jgi:beta-phosphoglucomutase-like phosphatase (HAD superfamily)
MHIALVTCVRGEHLDDLAAHAAGLAAARHLRVVPARTVVFEDATAGIEAARAGGFGRIIGVGVAEHARALRAHGAHAMVADLAEVWLEGRRPGAEIAV